MKKFLIVLVICFSKCVFSQNKNENDNFKSKTEILIVGTAHIDNRIPNSYLENTIQKLTDWKPDAVVVEYLPSELVQLYKQLDKNYSELSVGGMYEAKQMAKETQKHTSLNFLKAKEIIKSKNSTKEEKILSFLITYEPINALLHWNKALSLPKKVDSILSDYAKSGDEVHRIALPIAKKLNLPLLHHFDDHSGLELYYEVEKELDGFWESKEFKDSNSNDRVNLLSLEAAKNVKQKKDYWEMLKMLNSDEYQKLNYILEYQPYLKYSLSKNANNTKIAQWDTRNLFMAARLRLISGLYPKKKILVIVGSSHKKPIEDILKSISPDIEIKSFESFLNNKN